MQKSRGLRLEKARGLDSTTAHQQPRFDHFRRKNFLFIWIRYESDGVEPRFPAPELQSSAAPSFCASCAVCIHAGLPKCEFRLVRSWREGRMIVLRPVRLCPLIQHGAHYSTPASLFQHLVYTISAQATPTDDGQGRPSSHHTHPSSHCPPSQPPLIAASAPSPLAFPMARCESPPNS